MSAEQEILIVEDNPGDIRLMREALRDMHPPVRLEIAMDADQALEFLKPNAPEAEVRRPAFIFLDFNLPKGGSRELLNLIKNHPVLRVVPVAVLTTSDAERDINDAYALHANCYLRKPVDLDTFFSTIRGAAHFWLNVAFTPHSPALP